MNIVKRMAAAFLSAIAVLLFAAAPSVTACAEDGVIDGLFLEVVSAVRVGTERSARDIDVLAKGEGYEVRDVVLLPDTDRQVWSAAETPRFAVYLKADPGYTFAVDKTKIRIKGAEYEYGYWEEMMERYVLYLKLPALIGQIGQIAEAHWNSPTIAAWSPADNAARYEVQLYCDGVKRGPVVSASTNTCDLGAYMRVEGSYSYKVRAVNLLRETVKSDWRESGVSAVDAAGAAWLRQQYPISAGPGQSSEAAASAWQEITGWILEGSRWWYRNADGTYTTNNWQYIDGKWYYFDSKGYMVTGWIDWNDKSYYCDPESGAMLVNAVVPDGSGCRVDSTGALIE